MAIVQTNLTSLSVDMPGAPGVMCAFTIHADFVEVEFTRDGGAAVGDVSAARYQFAVTDECVNVALRLWREGSISVQGDAWSNGLPSGQP